ncbi:extracellular solute-binding protein [Paenibacillus thalictri]|uniref:Extracellular solute-binding protein n=1 Tax=Paenibacillus thalictri TaxID=2527873 RepID=A0A4Q9DN82_9BACL|nr:extracellular solute-binding protein [Paenibacillus thalictri]TBL75314.1 extracellular solute-binding protein [Paenibacillus thalictri]
MKKSLFTMMATALVFSNVVGCSSSAKTQPDAANNGAGGDGNEKIAINMMTYSVDGGGWPDNAEIVQELNKKLNIDLKIQWVPNDNYDNKLETLAAANNMPDLYTIRDIKRYLSWQQKGILMDVKPSLNQYPNLVKYLGEDGFKILNPKDKYYGLPYYVPETRDSLAIRQDWLDKLNLKMPTTIDEFYSVAKAFATQDPDGNGKQDTVGFSFAVNPQTGVFERLAFLQGAFGLANGWKEENGKLIPYQTQVSELKDMVAFLQKAYNEGVLDKDFAVNKLRDPLNKFEASKVGTGYVNPNEVYSSTIPSVTKVDPKAKVVQLLPPKGPKGQATLTGTGGTQKVVINGKIDPKKQQRILKLLDYMMSDEGTDLIKNGIEGVDYKKVDGNKYEKLDFDKNRPQILSLWFLRRYDPLIQVFKFSDPQLAQNLSVWAENNAKYAWKNPGAGLVSDTNVKIGASLDQKLAQALVKAIIDKESVDTIDKAVADWKSGGGDKIIKEINDAYAASKQ